MEEYKEVSKPPEEDASVIIQNEFRDNLKCLLADLNKFLNKELDKIDIVDV